jgi:hypothetical protein
MLNPDKIEDQLLNKHAISSLVCLLRSTLVPCPWTLELENYGIYTGRTAHHIYINSPPRHQCEGGDQVGGLEFKGPLAKAPDS